MLLLRKVCKKVVGCVTMDASSYCFLLLVLCSFFSLGRGIWFSEEEQKLVDKLLEEYSSHSGYYHYDSVISTGLENSRLIPKVFIWCPMHHNSIKVVCPVDRCVLTFNRWTLCVVKNNKFNPCLVYDLEGNIILIQASYVCPRGDQFFSASKDILDVLPGRIKDSFGFQNVPQICLLKSPTRLRNNIADYGAQLPRYNGIHSCHELPRILSHKWEYPDSLFL